MAQSLSDRRTSPCENAPAVGAAGTAAITLSDAANSVLNLTGLGGRATVNGELATSGHMVTDFAEKPDLNTGVVNGGFFMFDPRVLDYVEDDSEMLESGALQALTRDGELTMFLHEGFWRGMDTYREWMELNTLWDSGEAPWRVW